MNAGKASATEQLRLTCVGEEAGRPHDRSRSRIGMKFQRITIPISPEHHNKRHGSRPPLYRATMILKYRHIAEIGLMPVDAISANGIILSRDAIASQRNQALTSHIKRPPSRHIKKAGTGSRAGADGNYSASAFIFSRE